MSSPSVEPQCVICRGSSCQDQYLSKITAKGKASLKSLIYHTQLIQKFETLWGAEYAPKNDILYRIASSIQEQVHTLQQSSFIVSKQLVTSQKDLQPARQKKLLMT